MRFIFAAFAAHTTILFNMPIWFVCLCLVRCDDTWNGMNMKWWVIVAYISPTWLLGIIGCIHCAIFGRNHNNNNDNRELYLWKMHGLQEVLRSAVWMLKYVYELRILPRTEQVRSNWFHVFLPHHMCVFVCVIQRQQTDNQKWKK